MSGLNFEGQTVVCIASGPSLTESDCALVEKAGLPCIAVNSSWKIAPFAKVVYAGDNSWWHKYGKEIDIPAERWTCSQAAASAHKINYHTRTRGGYNSGGAAIEFAVSQGASRVLMLGYDCSMKNGTHWHGDHKRTKNPTPESCKKWKAQFQRVADYAEREGVLVLNCSRQTTLKCFERADLETCIESVNWIN